MIRFSRTINFQENEKGSYFKFCPGLIKNIWNLQSVITIKLNCFELALPNKKNLNHLKERFNLLIITQNGCFVEEYLKKE